MAQLRTYRRDAASGLSLLDVVTTTAVATGPDAASTVIVEAFRGSVGQTTFENSYVLPTDGAQAGQQRPTRAAGLNPSAATLKVTWAWDAPLELGTEVELHRLVPAIRELGRPGWNEIVNDVLRDIPTIRRHPVTAVDQTVVYTVPAYLDSEDQAIGVYDPGTPATEPQVPSANLKSIRYDGEEVEIELWAPYAAGEVFYFAAYQPTSTRIRAGGVWADTALGLVADDDEALASRRLVQAMAIQRAAEMELLRPDPRAKALWEQAYQRWTPIAAGLKRRLVPARPSKGPTALSVAAAGMSRWPKGMMD